MKNASLGQRRIENQAGVRGRAMGGARILEVLLLQAVKLYLVSVGDGRGKFRNRCRNSEVSVLCDVAMKAARDDERRKGYSLRIEETREE